MNRAALRVRVPESFFLFCLIITLFSVACTKSAPAPKEPPSKPSDIKVEIRDGGPVIITTSAAEFQILPSGFLQATLLKDGKRLSLDEPLVGSSGGSDSIVNQGKELDFVPDFSQAKTVEASGKLGRGKRITIPGRPLSASGVPLERTLTVEAYDDFPGIALVSASYKNVGNADFALDEVWMQQHRLNAKQVDPNTEPYDMWSFQGSSYDWGKDDVYKVK